MELLALDRCGRFCVVFMNPCHFHTGLVVVKPDLVEYRMLLDSLKNGASYDGADQGFLSHVYGERYVGGPRACQTGGGVARVCG